MVRVYDHLANWPQSQGGGTKPTLTESRPTPAEEEGQTLAKIRQPRFLHPALIFAAILIILAARSTEAWRAPQLAFEDGKEMLGYYFNTPEVRSVFRRYNGYMMLVPDSIAWLAARGPVRLVPYVFTLASLSIAGLGLFMVSRQRLAWLIPSSSDRAVVAVLLALLPLGNGLLICNLAYSIWNILFILLILLGGPLPRSKLSLVVLSFAVILCIFSHPLSIMALPICLVHVFREKSWFHRTWLGIYVLAIILYQMLCVDRSVVPVLSPSSIIMAGKLFFGRVLLETVFGAQVSTSLLIPYGRYVYCFGMLALSFLVILTLKKRTDWRLKYAVAFGVALSFAIVLASSIVRLQLADNQGYLFKPFFQRYFYVSKLLFALLLLSQFVPLLRAAWSRLLLSGRLVLLIAAACYLFAVNGTNNQYYRSSLPEGQRLSVFLSSVQEDLRSANAGLPYNPKWILPRQDGWDITLSIDKHLAKPAFEIEPRQKSYQGLKDTLISSGLARDEFK